MDAKTAKYMRDGLAFAGAVVSLGGPALLLILVGLDRLPPKWTLGFDGMILLAGAATNFLAVTAIATTQELSTGVGKTSDSYLLSVELIFFGAAMGYSLHKSGLSSAFNMWFSVAIILTALLVSPAMPDKARIGFLSWALALILSLYWVTTLLPFINLAVLPRIFAPCALEWLQPRYGAYLHLLAVPAAYVIFDSFLSVKTARMSRPLDWALLATGVVCLFLGFRVRAPIFELGSSTALLLFANSAYYIITRNEAAVSTQTPPAIPETQVSQAGLVT